MKVSVIIPAHNEEKYIGRTLDKIPSDVETIVVCNGCTDSTFKVADAFSKEKNVKIFNLNERGVSRARNHGAKMAAGDMLVFMDADIVPSDGLFSSISETPFTIGTCAAKSNIRKPVPTALMKLKSLTHRFGTCTGMIFCTKEMFGKAGGFDESLELGEDGSFLRTAKKMGNYGIVKGHVVNNMRRFEKKGYAGVCWFWVKNYFYPRLKKYDVVR